MIKEKIEEKLKARFNPLHLQVINESHTHSFDPQGESHFKIIVVSDVFINSSRLQKHRLVNDLLSEEISQIRAFSLSAYSPEEWEKIEGIAPQSPRCAGKSE